MNGLHGLLLFGGQEAQVERGLFVFAPVLGQLGAKTHAQQSAYEGVLLLIQFAQLTSDLR